MKDVSVNDIKDFLLPKLLEDLKVKDSSLLGGYQNLVYKASLNDKPIIIRITERSHRRFEEIKSEIDFLEYLHQHDVPVCIPITLKKYKTNNNIYYVTLFEFINGNRWMECLQTDSTYFMAGKTLGKIHKTSQQYDQKSKRENFKKNQYLEDAKKVFKDKALLKSLNLLIDKIDKLPRNKENYGLIHGDYNFANLIYKEQDQLSVIDFDESEYHYYVYDIAVYLFYYLLGANPLQIDSEPNIELFNHFMKGYLTEFHVSEHMVEQIPLFLRLREYKLLISLKRNHATDQWAKDYISSATKRIKGNQPFVEIDYQSLYHAITQD